MLLCTDADSIEAAQRLRYDVFTSEPGFTLTGDTGGLDADRFDEHCDHLLVRDEAIRVLLVQEYPSYEYRLLRSLLGRTLQRSGSAQLVELVGMIGC